MRFVDPEVSDHEKEDGFTRFEVMLSDSLASPEFPMICYLPEGAACNELVEKIGEWGLEWSSIQQLDGTITGRES